MMTGRSPLVALCLALAGLVPAAAPAAAAAASPPEPLVARIVQDLHADQRVSARQVRRALKPVDLDGDGRIDWMLPREAMGPGWCGTGGCWMQLWLTRARGPALKIFDGQVREIAFRSLRGRRIVDLDLHGSACGSFGAAACPVSFAWDERQGRLVEAPTPDGSAVVRYLRPVDTLDRAPPAAVRAAERQALARCRAAGGTASDGAAAITVPDVDGDGLRDWVVPAPYCDTQDAAHPAPDTVALLVTAGRTSRPRLAASGGPLEIDATAIPARVFALEAKTCDKEALQPKACRRHRLAWDARLGRFVRAR